MFAELRREDSGEGYYTLRYLVYGDDDLIGSYGVHFNSRNMPYGASRDFHKLVDAAEIERIKAYEAWQEGGYEGDPPPLGYGTYLNDCMYHDGQPSVCDGSGLVEVIINDDQRCFEIAAMMAEVDRGE